MRFEIKAGGAILILVGLAGLSLVVFALGLFAGYDMARNTAPDAPQTASVYPLPNPPASEEAKAPSKQSDAIASMPSGSAKTIAKVKSPMSSGPEAPSASMDKNAGPVTQPPAHTVASAAASVPPPKIAPPETDEEEPPSVPKPATSNADRYASAPESAGGKHKPFNIQIDAVMDRANADQMTQRLLKLGYHAFMVPTQISGQTWWRVRVGPYQSQDEASAAEQELRAKYKDTYAP